MADAGASSDSSQTERDLKAALAQVEALAARLRQQQTGDGEAASPAPQESAPPPPANEAPAKRLPPKRRPAPEKAAPEPVAEEAEAPNEVVKPAAKPRPAPAPAKPSAKPAATNGQSKPAAEKQPTESADTRSQPKPKQAAAKGQSASPEEAKVDETPQSRSLLNRWRLFAVSSWGLSGIVHAVLVVILGVWILKFAEKEEPPVLTSILEREDEELNEVLEEQIVVAATTDNSVSNPARAGSAAAIEGISEPSFDATVAESTDGPKVRLADVSMGAIRGSPLNSDLGDSAPGDPQAPVDNYDQAFDRLTQEILSMLSRNKVLVIWLFDQSESMKDDQKEIRDRIDRVYGELGSQDAASGDALWTAVCSYGATGAIHTKKPTADTALIKQAIDEVPIDKSGTEMMCQAVMRVIAGYSSFAKTRQLALVLVTDESGHQEDNVATLEGAISVARQAKCRVYCMGREAVFGYPYAHMWWTGSVVVGGKTHTRRFLVAVDRGPETPYVEQLQTNGLIRRQDAHPSGFGPYEQVRMARETGGIFFMLPSPEIALFQRDDRKYTLKALRPYLPNLERRDEYATGRDSHAMRATLWKVINDLNPYDKERAKHIVMRMHFSPRVNTFLQQVAEEKVKAAQYFLYLHAAEKALEEMQDDRDRETHPRWQANYDLMKAQLIAYKVRLYEYGAYLEDFVQNPKKIEGPPRPGLVVDYWEVRWRQETVTGELTEGYIQRSKHLFEKVIQYHPGTPWAARAEVELKRGFGVELFPHWRDPNAKGKPHVHVPAPKL